MNSLNTTFEFHTLGRLPHFATRVRARAPSSQLTFEVLSSFGKPCTRTLEHPESESKTR
ncbi:MAG: hypothetical protein QM784_38165 [Polyangiaceae bacterium]